MRIMPPDETLSTLNNALAGQCLPNCQFATACYGIIDGRTMELHLARGGHPYPIHVRCDGAMEEVTMGGGLLGVFAGEEFPAARVQMAPGEKLILYSDGLEEFFGLVLFKQVEEVANLRSVRAHLLQKASRRPDKDT